MKNPEDPFRAIERHEDRKQNLGAICALVKLVLQVQNTISVLGLQKE